MPSIVDLLPTLPIRPAQRSKNAALGKLQSSHRLGYRGFMEQTTVRKPHLKGHFGFATELSPSSRHGCVLYQEPIFQKLSTILDKSAFKPTYPRYDAISSFCLPMVHGVVSGATVKELEWNEMTSRGQLERGVILPLHFCGAAI